MIVIPHRLVDVAAFSLKCCLSPIQVELHYATEHNFTGHAIDGYAHDAVDVGLLPKNAAIQLCEAQDYLVLNYGCTLLIYDAYRPLQAINYFSNWCQLPQSELDKHNKPVYYPRVSKHELIASGYLPNTPNGIDVVLADVATNQVLDMGSPYNFFDSISQLKEDMLLIGADAARNRYILSSVLQRFGFLSCEKAYWHFEWHEKEPNEPLDIIISSEYRGIE